MRIAFIVAQDFNIGVGYILAYLKQKKHRVKLWLDYHLTGGNIINEVAQFNPDIVGISCITANFGWALSMAQKVKQSFRNPSFRIVLGGVHPTLCPEDVPKEYEACQGDGIAYFGGKFDPNKLWPEREMFFNQLPPIHRQVQMFMTSFGCPFKCSFCNNHQLHKKIVRRDPDNCIQEIIHWKNRGLKYVLFEDDIFTISEQWLREFLPLYACYIKLPFTCFGHPRYLNARIVRLLKASGCQMIWLGVQTGDEKVRQSILNRYETNQEIEQACKLIKRHKIRLMVDRIFGIPKEQTERQEEATYNFFRSLRPDVVNCYELLYFPKARINKYGKSKARYQKEGGEAYKRYAKHYASIPLGIY